MDAVEEAFRAIARAGFLPQGTPQVDRDAPIPIGHGQTNSQPRTVADMLRLLDVQPGQQVLDVGSGSGWTTALLARLVGPTGSVRGVEVVPELVSTGAENLAATHQPWASITPAVDGVLGLPKTAPYDRILVSAMATRLPGELVDQLGDPGRMVVPVAGEMVLVQHAGGQASTSTHGYYRFVPLVQPGQPRSAS